ncbi:hypothetical protein ACLB2K_063467 [Fragaria x ananassa]
MRIQDLVVEGDSSLLINCISRKFKCPWRLLQIIHDIKKIACSFQGICFQHILREANFAANALAIVGHQLLSSPYWEVGFPSVVSSVVNFDFFGAGCFRGFSL